MLFVVNDVVKVASVLSCFHLFINLLTVTNKMRDLSEFETEQIVGTLMLEHQSLWWPI